MDPLLWLIGGHFIADYPLQGEFLSQMKGKNNYLLLCHVLIYSLFLAAILSYLGLFSYWKLGILIISHTLIDWWKCHKAPKETALTTSLYIDQALHGLVLLLLLI